MWKGEYKNAIAFKRLSNAFKRFPNAFEFFPIPPFHQEGRISGTLVWLFRGFFLVLRGSVQGGSHTRSVHHIRVISLYRDDVDISKAQGTKILGARLNLKLYISPYTFPLRVGKEYILAGQLKNGRLHVKSTDHIFPFPSDNEWKNVSPTQREGLAYHNKHGCGCRIGRCYGISHCSQKVRGCEYSPLEGRPRFDVCRMRHQFCRMTKSSNGSGGHRSQWETRKTNEFKNCEKNSLTNIYHSHSGAFSFGSSYFDCKFSLRWPEIKDFFFPELHTEAAMLLVMINREAIVTNDGLK